MTPSSATSHDATQALARFAMVGAGLMLAHQVAGKAVRDGLFLSQFAPTDLPKIVLSAAVFAIATGLAFSRVLERLGPRRLVPVAFGVSGVLQAGEWLLYDLWPSLTAVVVYLHIVGLGAILLSGFWSLVSELFDPREARRWFGRIAASGTIGGITGGLVAERMVVWFSVPALLLLLGALHLACAAVLSGLRPPHRRVVSRRTSPPLRTFGAVFRQTPYLWQLAALVMVGTASAATLDFLFKTTAADTFGKGASLVRFFAIYYTTGQVITFFAQSLLSRQALSRLGLGRTVASLPVATAAGSLLAIVVPSFAVLGGVRALELVLRGSLFRSGYELFFTPVEPAAKRPAKTVIDVGCDRLGDALGAGLVQLALLTGPAIARTEILLIGLVFSTIGMLVAFRLDRAYVGVLEHGLINRAAELDLDDVQDAATLSVVLESMPQLRLPRQESTGSSAVASPQAIGPAAPPRLVDPAIGLLAELRSGDMARVRAALLASDVDDPTIAPQVVRLLAWDDVSDVARAWLERRASRMVGLLSDAMLDPDEDFAVRRRLPRVLARARSQRAVDTLVAGLDDARFEVRFQCGRALDRVLQLDHTLTVPADRVFARLDAELSVGRSVWASYKLLDRRDLGENSDSSWFLDDLLRERANQTLEHIFSLLALVLPREPLKVAFRALHTDDALLRGLALEYLESVLPEGIRSKLWAVIETDATTTSTPSSEAAERLLRSSQTISIWLEQRAKGGERMGDMGRPKPEARSPKPEA